VREFRDSLLDSSVSRSHRFEHNGRSFAYFLPFWRRLESTLYGGDFAASLIININPPRPTFCFGPLRRIDWFRNKNSFRRWPRLSMARVYTGFRPTFYYEENCDGF
jgi:hypothetical protein